mgnify:CR=1 FL=1
MSDVIYGYGTWLVTLVVVSMVIGGITALSVAVLRFLAWWSNE